MKKFIVAAASLMSLTAFPQSANAELVTVYRDVQQQVDVETKYSQGYGVAPYIVLITNTSPRNGVKRAIVAGTMICSGPMYQVKEFATFDASDRLISRTIVKKWQTVIPGSIDDRIYRSLCNRSPFDEP